MSPSVTVNPLRFPHSLEHMIIIGTTERVIPVRLFVFQGSLFFIKWCSCADYSERRCLGPMLIRSEVLGKNIGKLMASSKRMIKWGLIINMKKVEIMLKHSIVSGKRLIRVNEVVVHESRGVRFVSGE